MISELLNTLKDIDPTKFRLEIDHQGYVVLYPVTEKEELK